MEWKDNFIWKLDSYKRRFFYILGGISEVLIELHKSVLQCIRNGRILHSDIMKEAISENIKRAQILNNQLERKVLNSRKMLEKEKKSPDEKKKKRPANLTQHHPPPAPSIGQSNF